MPDALILAMRAADCIHIETELASRVAFLIGDYAHFLADASSLRDRLNCLVELHGREVIARWNAAIEAGDWTTLVADLLQNHYDPAYSKSMPKNYTTRAAPLAATTAIQATGNGVDAVWVSGRKDKPECTFQPSIAALARQASSPKKKPAVTNHQAP